MSVRADRPDLPFPRGRGGRRAPHLTLLVAPAIPTVPRPGRHRGGRDQGRRDPLRVQRSDRGGVRRVSTSPLASGRTATILVGIAVAFFTAACGGGDEVSPAGPPEVSVRIVGKDLRFDKATLQVPPDTPFTVVFDHLDEGVPHNFAIYRTGPPAADPIAKTAVETGPVVEELAVEGLAAGSYLYQCDVHPTTMTGTLEVG